MAFLYDPGLFMPGHRDDFDGTSWMVTWPTGPWHLHDTEPGGTVYLVRAGAEQRIVWETRVTRSFAVPYESVDGLAAEVQRRWGLRIDTSRMNPHGFCIGWQAEPVARLDRSPLSVDERLRSEGETDTDLDLDGFQFSEWVSPAFRARWQLTDGASPPCTGRARVGWSGANHCFGT